MEKQKIVVTGLCYFCGKENPVIAESEKGEDLLDSENYSMTRHKVSRTGPHCKGEGKSPEVIIVN